jgi:hypothetical protein
LEAAKVVKKRLKAVVAVKALNGTAFTAFKAFTASKASTAFHINLLLLQYYTVRNHGTSHCANNFYHPSDHCSLYSTGVYEADKIQTVVDTAFPLVYNDGCP